VKMAERRGEFGAHAAQPEKNGANGYFRVTPATLDEALKVLRLVLEEKNNARHEHPF